MAPALLGAGALILCVIMSVHSLSGIGLVGCGAGSSCDTVLGSRWSLILGILPVSLLAAGVYISFLILLFLLDKVEEDYKPLLLKLELVICGAIAGSAVWFILLQIFVLGTFCKYCMAAHTIGIILSVLMILFAKLRGLGGRFRLCCFAAGVALAALLAGFQALTVDRSTYQEGYSEELLPQMSDFDFPVLGNPDAKNIVELLYDYQCPHCRKVHQAAEQIVAEHPGEYAFVLCPCPLSNACNPYIPAGKDNFTGSCEYARLALAVWALDRSSFSRVDEYLWTSPSLEDARTFVASIVGEKKLDSYLSSEAPFTSLSIVFELFGRTTSEGKGGLPRLISGQSWIIPEISEAAELYPLLEGL